MDGNRTGFTSGSNSPLPYDEQSSLLGSDATTERPQDLDQDRMQSDFASPADYGSTKPSSSRAAGESTELLRPPEPADASACNSAFATLPTRLARSQSMARKVERKQKRQQQWATWRHKLPYYIPVRFFA